MKIKEMYDVSRRLKNGMTQYPGDTKFELKHDGNYDGGFLNSSVVMSVHTGTHVDAPMHINKHGQQIEEVDLDHFVGSCILIESNDDTSISMECLEGIDDLNGKIVLFKTRNSNTTLKEEFDNEFVYISDEVCQYLVNKKAKTIGVDYLSVDKPGNSSAHDILLNSGVSIIEGLCFKNVPVGEYYISALPLKLHNCEASPVRAVLFKFKD